MIPILLNRPNRKLISMDALFRKIPRPDRSGFMSVLLMYVLLFSAGGYSDKGEPSLLATIFCAILPFGCPASNKAGGDKGKEEKESRHQITYLLTSPYPSKSRIRESCSCHVDVQEYGKEIVHDVWPRKDEIVSCNSDLYSFRLYAKFDEGLDWNRAEALKWQPVVVIWQNQSKDKRYDSATLSDATNYRPANANVRWHCTGGKK